MLRTLAIKETRELAPLAALIFVVQCLLAAAAASGIPLLPWTYPAEGIPFYADAICKLMLVVGGAAAAVLGLVQAVRESSRGTFPFLLHRPASRDALFGTKLIAGATVYVLSSGLPLAIYTLWAATPGTHTSPFLWAMAAPIWLIWAELILLYLGGFLSGLRPGRWLGTRLFPVGASLLILVLVQFAAGVWIAPIICAVASGALLAAILNVGTTRDY
jgi:hypothetical protein